MSGALYVMVTAAAVVMVLGVVTLLTRVRRSDVRGVGVLDSKTVRQDRSNRSRAGPVIALSNERSASLPGRSWSPPGREQLGVDRRQFLNRATVSLMGAGIGAFAASGFVAFLWPKGSGGFGERVALGRVDDIRSGIDSGGGFLYSSEARTWITEFPAEAIPAAAEVYDPVLMPGIAAGLIASYQKCPHLGCRVPECLSSQWFECPCHGSRYSRVGEHRGGPAPRGLDHFPLEIAPGGEVTVDTSALVIGMPLGTNTTGQEAEGPSCFGDADQ